MYDFWLNYTKINMALNVGLLGKDKANFFLFKLNHLTLYVSEKL